MIANKTNVYYVVKKHTTLTKIPVYCLYHTDIPRLVKKYPQWNRAEIEDMKIQFNSYDLNHDGLIDFPEL